MSTQTTNLQLTKPDENDYYDISVQNENMDKIDESVHSLSTNVEELKKSVSDGKTLVANAITGKGISTSKDATFQTMATNISAIETNPTLQAKTVALSTAAQTVKADSGYDGLSQVTVPAVSGNAVAGDVLSGKTFASGSGVSQSGTMVNNGAINQTLAINGTYTIPSGYHNGSGKVTQSISTKGAATYTPSTKDQTIASGQYLSGVQTIKGDANLISSNILNGKTIFGVTGNVAVGKKFATGTSSTPTYNLTFTDISNDSRTLHGLTITGLNFKPSMVFILTGYSGTTGGGFTVYKKDPTPSGMTQTPNTIIMGYLSYKGELTPTIRQIQNDTAAAYINDTGFCLPIAALGYQGEVIRWYAWE